MSFSLINNHTEKDFKKIWQLLNIFHLLLITSKPSFMHSFVWCFLWRDGGRIQWTFVSFEHPLAYEERCWREWSRTPVCYLKNRIITLLNDSSTFESAEQLNAWKGKKYFQEVSKTLSHLNVKYSCGSTKLQMEEYMHFWH